jgi:hypothetical protein
MAKDEEIMEVAELVLENDEGTPRFRDALLGIRSGSDLKAVVTNENYDPHVHLIALLIITFIVGTIFYGMGW